MSIRDEKAYLKGIWDWAILDGCFGNSKARMGDLDGIIERNGHFLVVEAKSPHASVPVGQGLMFSAMAKLPSHTVVVIWGDSGTVEKMCQWPNNPRTANNDDFRQLTTNWWRMACGRRNQATTSTPVKMTPKGPDYGQANKAIPVF